MPETAKNDALPDAEIHILSPAEQLKAMKKPWQRMEGEKTLWFNRFSRYLALGPKRKLLAALEQEQQSIKALKSTQAAASQSVKAVSGRAGKGKTPHLVEVKSRPQVPGSWKQACVTWRWVERAQAYDSWKIARVVEAHINEALTETACSIERVLALKVLLKHTQDTFNANAKNLTHEQFNMYTARMQSILRDIRDEMRVYDPEIARISTTYMVSQLYVTATPEELKTGRLAKK